MKVEQAYIIEFNLNEMKDNNRSNCKTMKDTQRSKSLLTNTNQELDETVDGFAHACTSELQWQFRQ